MADSISRILAEYASGVSSELNSTVERETKRRLRDALGLALGAGREEAPRAVRRYAYQFPFPGGCSIWGTPFKTTPETATLANGIALRYFDYNDTYLGPESMHPSDMISGITVMGEWVNASGKDLLAAIAVAYEVGIALCDAMRLRKHGWDHTIITSIGAACGISRLMGLSAREIEHALAIAVVPHAPMRQTRAGELSMWKALAAPDAVRNAVYACLLAAVGVEGPYQPFEGEMAFEEQLLGGEKIDKAALEPLHQGNSPSRIATTLIKAWPAEYHSQSGIEATLAVRKRIANPARIRKVKILTFHEANLIIAKDPEKWRPKTRETADHSLPYIVAAALLDGRIDLGTFKMERINDPEIQRFLQEKMSLEESPELTARYPEGTPTRIEVETDDGQTLVGDVTFALGHFRNPMSEEQLLEKFNHLAAPVIGTEGAARLSECVGRLETASSVRQLTEMLVV